MKVTAAVRYEAQKPFVIEELDLAEPNPDEVLVKIVGTGVCHTDLVLRDALPPMPAVFGHEGSGVVEKIGSAVSKVAVGDHVVLSFAHCGACGPCQSGRPGYCTGFNAQNVGGARPDGSPTLTKDGTPLFANFFGQSSWASYALANQRNVVKVGKDVPIELLGPLGCGFQTGAGAVINTLQARPGTSIAIFGVGSVGLAAIMGAAICGCSKIIAVDVKTNRLNLAKELGATHTVNAKEMDPVEAIRGLTEGGVDYSLECSSIPAVLVQAFQSVLPNGGVCGLISAVPGDITINTQDLLGGRTLRGLIEGDSVPDVFIPQLVEAYKQGRFPIDRLIKTYPMSDFNKAVADSEEGRTVKSIVIP